LFHGDLQIQQSVGSVTSTYVPM